MLARFRLFSKNFIRQQPILWELLLKRRYRLEIQLIKGKQHNKNEHKSIIHFSVNKAATQYVKQILRDCATENGMLPIDLASYAFHSGFPQLYDLSKAGIEKYQALFRSRGYLYSVFGGMVEGINDLDRYLILLMVRDPRDVLVSDYYSIAYSHPSPSIKGEIYEKFIKRKEFARSVSIDEYVLTYSDKVRNSYNSYIDKLLRYYPHTKVVRYEEMISDFEKWLNDILKYCELEISGRLFSSLEKMAKNKRPKKENVYKHTRKGQAGDYKNKLKRETIDHLNLNLSPILEKFAYL